MPHLNSNLPPQKKIRLPFVGMDMDQILMM